jgi:hypothetical protein
MKVKCIIFVVCVLEDQLTVDLNCCSLLDHLGRNIPLPSPINATLTTLCNKMLITHVYGVINTAYHLLTTRSVHIFKTYCVFTSICLTTGWTVRRSNPGGWRNFLLVQTGPGAHPASCKMVTGSFQGVNYGRGVLLTTHPLLVPRSWKSRAIPLLTLWATTGPVMGQFTFTGICAEASMWLFHLLKFRRIKP